MKSDELFELIKALEKNEKRYFKIFASKHAISGENKYLRIFEILDEQEIYDEKLLKKALKGDPILKQLSVAKNYLKNNILKSLRTFHSNVGTRREVNSLVDYSIILVKKRLFNHAKKLIKKALKICWDNDIYDQISILKNIELIINRQESNIQEVEHFINEGYKESLKALKLLENHQQYVRLMLKFESIYEKLGVYASNSELSPLHQLMQHELLQDQNQALSFKSKGNFLDMNCKYYALTGNRIKEYETWLALKNLHHEYPKTIVEHSNNYVQVISKLAALAIKTDQKENAEKWLHFLRELPEKYDFPNPKYTKGYVLQNYYEISISKHLKEGNLKEALALEPQIKEDMELIKKSGSTSDILYLYQRLAQINFYSQQFNEALHWLDLLIYDSDSDLHSNLKIQAQILTIITHYELGNDDLVTSLIRSNRRKLKAKKEELVIEFQFFSLALKLIKSNDKQKRTNCFNDMKQLFQELDNPKQKAKYYSYQAVLLWIKSKLKRQTIQDLIKNKS